MIRTIVALDAVGLDPGVPQGSFPCAFTTYATCPLPPKENRLTLAINVGEKTYRGDHD